MNDLTQSEERELEAQRREQNFVEAGGDREFTPKFGDTIRGIWASVQNPQRDGFYIRTVRRTGRLNPGTFYELTDGKGNLWQYTARDTVLVARASLCAPHAAIPPDATPHEWREAVSKVYLAARRDGFCGSVPSEWLDAMRAILSASAAPTRPRFQWCCESGCGPCDVKRIEFEYMRTETMDGVLLDSKTIPRLVSACCGADLSMWDNEKDEMVDLAFDHLPIPSELASAAQPGAMQPRLGEHNGGDYDMRHQVPAAAPAAQPRNLAKHQPCGCVVCSCEDAEQCHGCGAKHCGTHPLGQFSSPVYEEQAAPAAPDALSRSHELLRQARDALERNLNWLTSYPGGGPLSGIGRPSAYDESRSSIAAITAYLPKEPT